MILNGMVVQIGGQTWNQDLKTQCISTLQWTRCWWVLFGVIYYQNFRTTTLRFTRTVAVAF